MSSPAAPRSPTLEDVAQVAGVSRATVSRVVNGVRNVDPELHKVVWAAVSATGYVPNRAARSLVTRRTNTVGLVLSDSENHAATDPFMSRFLTDPYFGRVIGGMLSVLRPLSVHLALMVVGTEEARLRLVADLRQGSTAGAVILSLHPGDSLPSLVAEAGIPAVLFGRPASRAEISYVDVANANGAALAVAHLLGRGCQRIGIISGPPEVPASQDREYGFRQELARRGHAYVPSAEGSFTLASGEQAMRKLLQDAPGLDGVFAFNDLMAQGALRALHEAGRRVPDDVAVVGFDDSSPALSARPTLTTIHYPIEKLAAEAVRMLNARIDDPSARVTSLILEPSLVIRQSA